MSELSTIVNCNRFSNLGWAACAYVPLPHAGLLAVPSGTKFSAAQLAVLKATILALLVNNTPASRGHIITGFTEVEAMDEAGQETTRANGQKIRTRFTTPGWIYTLDQNFGQFQALSKWNSGTYKNYDFIAITTADDNGMSYLEGKSVTNTDGTISFMGRAAGDFMLPNWSPAKPGEAPKYQLQWQLKHPLENTVSFAQVACQDTDGTAIPLLDWAGTTDFEIVTATATGTAGQWDLTIKYAQRAINFAGKFGTSLLAAGLTAYNGNANNTLGTGAAITITSLTAMADTGGTYYKYRIQLNAADPDYPAAGDPLTIKSTSISVLAGEGIGSITDGTVGTYELIPKTLAATV